MGFQLGIGPLAGAVAGVVYGVPLGQTSGGAGDEVLRIPAAGSQFKEVEAAADHIGQATQMSLRGAKGIEDAQVAAAGQKEGPAIFLHQQMLFMGKVIRTEASGGLFLKFGSFGPQRWVVLHPGKQEDALIQPVGLAGEGRPI